MELTHNHLTQYIGKNVFNVKSDMELIYPHYQIITTKEICNIQGVQEEQELNNSLSNIIILHYNQNMNVNNITFTFAPLNI
jgi:hypothetical protein